MPKCFECGDAGYVVHEETVYENYGAHTSSVPISLYHEIYCDCEAAERAKRRAELRKPDRNADWLSIGAA